MHLFQKIKEKVFVGEFIRFAFVGVIATIIHYGVYLLLMRIMEVNLSYSIGYILGFVANFFLNTFFTFRTKPILKNLFGMAGAHLINYAVHIILLNFFIWIAVPPKIAPIPVYCIAVPINFFLVRFVFKNSRKTNKPRE